MSKSTNRYGKVTLHAFSSIDANPKPTRRLLREWKELDKLSRKIHNKPYDALTSKQKTQLHYDINVGTFDEKEAEKK